MTSLTKVVRIVLCTSHSINIFDTKNVRNLMWCTVVSLLQFHGPLVWVYEVLRQMFRGGGGGLTFCVVFI